METDAKRIQNHKDSAVGAAAPTEPGILNPLSNPGLGLARSHLFNFSFFFK